MTNDMETFRIGIYPAVPHDLMRIICIFRNPYRIDFSASTIVLFPSIMRIGVGENNVYTTRTYPFSRSRAYFPILPPASYGFHGMLILIPVVIAGIISF